MKVLVAPEAEQELIDGAVYYARQAYAELGLAFIGEFERALSDLATRPHLGVPWQARTRRFPLRRFPYSIIYRIEGDELRVIALAHQRRHPGYWLGRK